MIINAGFDDNGKVRRLRLAPADIEEAVARCGWSCLNDAKDISKADAEEIYRLEAQEFVSMTTETGADALKWWKAREIPEEVTT